MSRICRYILAHDTGRAPCINGGTLTLATCKPLIRRKAQPGDWVAGFLPAPHRGILTYAARVAARIDWTVQADAWPGRRDACYRVHGGRSVANPDADYHADACSRSNDLDAPVLLFAPGASWYFAIRPVPLPAHLAPSGCGHRVTGTGPGDIEAIGRWLAGTGSCGVSGTPRRSAPRPPHPGAASPGGVPHSLRTRPGSC